MPEIQHGWQTPPRNGGLAWYILLINDLANERGFNGKLWATECIDGPHPFFPRVPAKCSSLKNICRTTSHLHLHIFTSAHPHSHLYLCSSSHLHSQLHIYISAHLHILTSTSLLIFIFTHSMACACQVHVNRIERVDPLHSICDDFHHFFRISVPAFLDSWTLGLSPHTNEKNSSQSEVLHGRFPPDLGGQWQVLDT